MPTNTLPACKMAEPESRELPLTAPHSVHPQRLVIWPVVTPLGLASMVTPLDSIDSIAAS